MTASRIGSLALAALLLVLPGQAWAVELNQWVQGLKAQVFVTERLEYQTNVQQTKAHTSDDLISRTIPGVSLTYDRGGVLLGGGYRAEILRFTDRTDLDNDHHIAFAQVGLNYPRFKFNQRFDFVLTSDPPTTELNSRIDSTTFSLTPEFQYQITPRFGVGVNYAFTNVQFENRAKQLNRDEHLFGAFVAWKIVPKADLRVGYAYGFKDFRNNEGNIAGNRNCTTCTVNRDVDARHLATVGLRGELTPKLSSTFTVGYEIREQRDPRIKDSENYIVGGDWTYRPTERTRIALFTGKSFEESIFGQTQKTVLFESTNATLTGEQRLGQKLRVNARVGGVLNEYPVRDFTVRESPSRRPQLKRRTDEILSYGAGVDYDLLKWLLLGVEYAHVVRDSTFREFQYQDDKVTAKLTLQY